MKKILIIEHVPFEKAGIISKNLLKMGFEIEVCQIYEDNLLPKLETIAGIVIMGGPMGIYDDHLYPWLKIERDYLKKAVKESKAIFGVCLGAQLIADACGALVYQNEFKEIGIFPIEFKKDFMNKIKIPDLTSLEVLHWHGDTFDIPMDATLLGSSKACVNQGFLWNNNVLALQFHLESTKDSVKLLLENCANELQDNSNFIQDEALIIKNLPQLKDNEALLIELLKRIFII